MSVSMTQSRSGIGGVGLAVLGLIALALALTIFVATDMGFNPWYVPLGIVATIAFGFFLFYPALGLYVTVAVLLLQGSSGIISIVAQESPLALTAAQLVGVAALAAWGTNLLARRAQFHYNMPVIVISLFMFWALLATLLSPYASDQWSHWVRLVARFGFFLLAVNLLVTPRALHYYVVVMILCGGAMALVAVAQYFLPSLQVAGAAAWSGLSDVAYIDQESLQGEAAIRVSGRAGHSNWLALIILMLLPLNLYWWQSAKYPMSKLAILAITAAEVVALVLTYTRTGLVIGVVLAALLFYRRFVTVTPLSLLLGLLALVAGFMALPDAYKERVLSPKQYTGSESVQSRLELQSAALDYAVERPLLGWGQGGFGLLFQKENNETSAVMRSLVQYAAWDPIFIGTHNLYLQISADSGFVGLLLYLVFFALVVRRLLKREKLYKDQGDEQGAALAGTLLISLIGFALIGFFLHALHQEIWWMVTAAAVALGLNHVDFREGLKPLSLSAEAKPAE